MYLSGTLRGCHSQISFVKRQLDIHKTLQRYKKYWEIGLLMLNFIRKLTVNQVLSLFLGACERFLALAFVLFFIETSILCRLSISFAQ